MNEIVAMVNTTKSRQYTDVILYNYDNDRRFHLQCSGGFSSSWHNVWSSRLHSGNGIKLKYGLELQTK